MTELDFGVYEAVVTDNTTFWKTGKIKVRVKNFFNGKFDTDLTRDFNEEEYKSDTLKDLNCLVHTPIGTGTGYGLFALPQINSIGLVQFINGNIKRPIWMGSFYNPTKNNEGKTLNVNFPSDIPEAEGPGSEGSVLGEKKIDGDFGTLILRTKQTAKPTNNSDVMDFGEQRTENLIVVSKDKIDIRHFTEWEKEDGKQIPKEYQTITFSKNQFTEEPQIDIFVTKIEKNDTQRTGIHIENQEVSLNVENEKNNTITDIKSTLDGVDISVTNTEKNKKTSFRMEDTSITLINDQASILMEDNEISVSAANGVLRLSGKEVMIGDGGGYIVTKDSPTAARLEDGTILKTSKARA